MNTLVFTPHPACPDSGIQATVTISDEIKISIIQGPAFYCTANSYEVAITFTNPITEESVMKVSGWKSLEEVENIIKTMSDFN